MTIDIPSKYTKLPTDEPNGGRDCSPDDPIVYSGAPAPEMDSGSDTEEDNDDERDQLYLNKQVEEDPNRKHETVFGPGVDVWKSFGGHVYTEINDKVKRKMRQEELWTEENLAIVKIGMRCKDAETSNTEVEKWLEETGQNRIVLPVPLADGAYPQLPLANEYMEILPPNTPGPLNPPKLRTGPPKSTLYDYHTRRSEALKAHRIRKSRETHCSAGIDLLGARNRCLKRSSKRGQFKVHKALQK
ncbi:hypothetical protein GQ44DRAFT_759248 [Phaeosphaeriaceae sp. PMI808]|nr:hypothetical protein GQ44DRAFT_759248 [Phaeosphaeriaceae sp. PMI808]